ncbi:MAG: synthase subunit [Firmicutes bacterium]|nr:synthase subunit [Bacillota bacterium]
MEIEVSKLIATLINFLILFLILKHYLFKPVNNMIDKRQNEIIDKITKTDEDMKKAEALKSENEKILSGAKDEGKNIVEGYKVKAEQLSNDIVKGARDEADTIIKRAKTEAERQTEKAADEIKTQIVDLAVLMSAKALGETIDEDQHRRLIKDFIVKVGI